MNQTKLISVSDIVIDLLERTGDNSLERMKPTIARWAKWADLKISTKGQWKRKTVLLPIDGNQVELPIDYVLIEYVCLGDQTANPYAITDTFQNIIQSSILLEVNPSPAVFYWSGGNVNIQYIDWVIQYDRLVFPYDSLNEDQCTLIYLSYESDNEGLPMIRETHKDAVRKYIEIQIMERDKWKTFRKGDVKMAKAIKQLVREEIEEWHLYVRQARANDSTLTNSDLRNMSYMWNNPYSGRNNFILK